MLRVGGLVARLGPCAALASALVACASDARCPEAAECPVCPAVVASALAGSTAATPPGAASSLPIDLPKAAIPSEVQAVLVVSIAANGDLFLADRKVANEGELRDLIRARAAKEPDLRATIQADRAVPHGTVIQVLDALKQAGVTRIAFGVSAPAPAVVPAP